MIHTSWQCHPMEPGETSQISTDPSSFAAATFDPSALVARATTAEGFQSMELFRCMRSFSIDLSDHASEGKKKRWSLRNALKMLFFFTDGIKTPKSVVELFDRDRTGSRTALRRGFRERDSKGEGNPFDYDIIYPDTDVTTPSTTQGPGPGDSNGLKRCALLPSRDFSGLRFD